MRLVHFDLTIRFSTKSPSIAEEVFKSIGGKGQYLDAERPVSVRREKEKLAIEWRPDRCRIVLEDAGTLEHCVEEALVWLSRINLASPIRRVNMTRVDTSWILPAPNDDFVSLERKYRAAMIVIRETIMEGTFDCSVMFDAKINDWALYHQSGAMESNQLRRQFLSFTPDEVPEVFIFLLLRITDENVLEYTEEGMRERLTRVFDYSKSHGDAFARIREGTL